MYNKRGGRQAIWSGIVALPAFEIVVMEYDGTEHVFVVLYREFNVFVLCLYIVHPHSPRRRDPSPHQNSNTTSVPLPHPLPLQNLSARFFDCNFDDFAVGRGEEGSETAACEGGVEVEGLEGVEDADVGCVAIGI